MIQNDPMITYEAVPPRWWQQPPPPLLLLLLLLSLCHYFCDHHCT